MATPPLYQFQVQVKPRYLSDQSAPGQDQYFFAYTITIRNTGSVAAQLIARTWNVNDAAGHHEKVKGLGVVGHQPLCSQVNRSSTPAAPGCAHPPGPCTAVFFALQKTVKNLTWTSRCLSWTP